VVEIGSDIEGFVPMSQLGIPELHNPGDAVKEGQALDMKVLEVDPIHHRIVLAATGFPQEEVIVEVKEEVKEEVNEDAKEPGPTDA
jgi:small subunit ribosomal protein S1